MSVEGDDGRDEPLDEGGYEGTEPRGLTSWQVPSQGGGRSGGASGVSCDGGVPGRSDDVPGRHIDVSGRHGDMSGHSVPAQRERYDGVLPRSRERDPDLPPSDSELIGRMRAGDDTAYEELYRRHVSAVRRYARTCCRDAHTADDLTAEVFARVLQAVRGGSGPDHAVRAYLLTTVRRVAASWTKSARREHLVDDFALFATQAARSAGASDDAASLGSFGAGLDLGADVRAMHDAEQSMAMRAFRSLPERWQAVLWHTEVEDESPSEVATLFGLDANGTRVLASRAREGLKQAYLQAHVSAALATNSEECARYSDRLGAYARGSLRTRAERGLRQHLEECAKCRLAAGQIKEVASGIPAVVPVAVIGWSGAAGYAKTAALVAGGASGVGAGAGAGAGVAGAAGANTAAGPGTAAGADTAAGGGSGGASAGGGAAAPKGLGAPVKAGIAAGVVAAGVVTAVVLAMAGDDRKDDMQVAGPPPSKVAEASPEPEPSTPAKEKGSTKEPEKESEKEPKKESATAPQVPAVGPVATPVPTPTPTPTPPPSRTPDSAPTKGSPSPEPTPTATPVPPPPPAPPASPAVFQWNELEYGVAGDGTRPEMRLGESSWVWQRYGVSIAGRTYANGVTVNGLSSVTVDLNRQCTAYDALVGVDDRTHGLGKVSFSVYADGVRLWKSPLVAGGDPAVPVHLDLSGRRTVRLVVEPHSHVDVVALADWAEARFTCG
ncbi:sigma-70 family RNA polymerase sigma factor [Streptomyces acidicola]|uniref:sigma-70 family RNA polymerase sigma factor n=1 Tax=Streptomyces acidicola TaxID=2596892 RepID=UPI0037890580